MSRIVPSIGELIKNSNINDTVLDAYYSIVPQPRNKSQLFIEDADSYSGKLSRFYQPFHNSLIGAYVLEYEWESLQYKVDNPDYPEYTKETVLKYLEKYAKGFHFGFFNFKKDILETKTSIFDTNENRSQIVLDYANRRFPNISRGFNISYIGKKHIFSDWYSNGIELGYFYKAWYIILENHKVFESHFIKSCRASKPTKNIISLKEVSIINDGIINTIQTILSPLGSLLYNDLIICALTHDSEVAIDQSVINIFSYEAQEISNYIEQETDLNNPKNAQTFFYKKFKKLFEVAADFKEIPLDDYRNKFNDFLHFSKETVHEPKILENSEHLTKSKEKTKLQLQYINIEHFLNNIDVLRSAILHSVEIINKTVDNLYAKNSQPTKTTFKTSLSKTQIKNLYDGLIAKFICSKTTYKEFEAVFKGVDVEKIRSKLVWLGANNLLAYFIDAMIREGYIKEVNHWDIAKHCFTNSGNLANASIKYKETRAGQPKKANIINKILKGL